MSPMSPMSMALPFEGGPVQDRVVHADVLPAPHPGEASWPAGVGSRPATTGSLDRQGGAL